MGQGQFRGEFVCFALRHGFKSRAYSKLSTGWPLHKNRTPSWGSSPNGKDTPLKLRLSSVCAKTEWPCLRVQPAVKVSDELKNAKSRHVGWRLCRSLWNSVLAQGHAGDGQHQKHAGFWRETVGQGLGASIFSALINFHWGFKLYPRDFYERWFREITWTKLLSILLPSTRLCPSTMNTSCILRQILIFVHGEPSPGCSFIL